MSILCELFGHKPPASYSEHSSWGGGNYLTVSNNAYVDGIGRGHANVTGMCPRCGANYIVGITHVKVAK